MGAGPRTQPRWRTSNPAAAAARGLSGVSIWSGDLPHLPPPPGLLPFPAASSSPLLLLTSDDEPPAPAPLVLILVIFRVLRVRVCSDCVTHPRAPAACGRLGCGSGSRVAGAGYCGCVSRRRPWAGTPQVFGGGGRAVSQWGRAPGPWAARRSQKASFGLGLPCGNGRKIFSFLYF